MQVSVEATGNLERKLTIDVPASQIDEASLKKMKELAKTQRINGFRPGKVPLNVIKKRYGDYVREEIASEVMQRSFYEAVMQEKLHPVSRPQIQPVSMEEGKDLQFTATFEVEPQVELKDFAEVTLEKKRSEVTDQDVKNMLEKLSDQYGDWQAVDRKAKNGDQAIIDFKGFIDDEVFEGGEAKDFALELGSGQMIAGFEEQLIDSKADDAVKIDVTFPENYQKKELSGKAARFEVTVKKINQKHALTEEQLAEKLAIKDADVSQLHEDIRSNMQKELKQVISNQFKEQLMKKLAEMYDFELPKAMIDQEVLTLKQQMMERFGGAAAGGNAQDLPSELFTDKAIDRVKLGLILREIVQQQNIKVEQDQLTAKLEEFAASYDDPQQVINYYMSDKNRLKEVEQLVLEENVINYLEQQAKITEKAVTFDELMNPKEEKTNQ